MQKADIELADLSQASDQDIKLKDGKVLGETDSEEDEVVIETNKDGDEFRLIRLDGNVLPPNSVFNGLNNQKYSIWSFLPQVLYDQFKFFFNMFFLLLALSQFVTVLKIGLLFSFVAPLVFVLTMTLIKEGYDDYKRYMRDKETNNQKYRVLRDTGFENTIAAKLAVGDIVEVNANQRVPADLILLYTNDPSGAIFIRTDQLDGETDWKIRKPVLTTQKCVLSKRNLRSLGGGVRCKGPNKLIYNFEGVFTFDNGAQEALELENTMWCNTVLCAGKILGLVVYTGKETRMEMNSKEARQKRGTFDNELNSLSKYLFGVMLGLSISLFVLSERQSNPVIGVFKYILLLSAIIPISLRVNLDFSKIVFSYKISTDNHIEGAVARNSGIPEELGRVEFILSDKTGTLTQNEMIFKSLSMENLQVTHEDLENVKPQIISSFHETSSPMDDVFTKLEKAGGKKQKFYHREQSMILRDIVTALVLCHNVTPVEEEIEEHGEDKKEKDKKNPEKTKEQVDEENSDLISDQKKEVKKQKSYQASSPDEVALVKLADQLGVELIERDQKTIKILIKGNKKFPKDKIEQYDILENFPFSSDTKRMGILMRHTETKRLIFYLKGADTALIPKISEVQTGFVMDECENLATEGLRTLVITQKAVTEKEYRKWKEMYEEASLSLDNRAGKMRKIVEALERDMEFLGITGVEDKLQEDVRVSIESLRNAGIKIWMLTGDKIETACCIAISTSLKDPTETFFIMSDIKEKQIMEREINSFGNDLNNKKNRVLVIDGTSLATAIEYGEKLFFSLATRVKTVIACRCSPTQKAYVTEKIKFYTGSKTLGIGDGGNDVGMILTADVGVGIVGKEGKQAALSSDFSILKFKHLVNLLLWHGRNSYKRGAVLAQYVIHRGLVIALIEMYFTLFYYFCPTPLYNGFLLLGYATMYTMLPTFSLIFDEDIDIESALKYPPLYKTLQKGRELDKKSFLIWVWKSIYQGFLVMYMAIVVFKENHATVVTMTFSSLILIQIYNICASISRPNKIVVITSTLSVAAYFVSIIMFQEWLVLSKIDVEFVFKMIWTIAVACVPLSLLKSYMSEYHPSEDQKIMREAKSAFNESLMSKICNKLKCWGKKDSMNEEMKLLMNELEQAMLE